MQGVLANLNFMIGFEVLCNQYERKDVSSLREAIGLGKMVQTNTQIMLMSHQMLESNQRWIINSPSLISFAKKRKN